MFYSTDHLKMITRIPFTDQVFTFCTRKTTNLVEVKTFNRIFYIILIMCMINATMSQVTPTKLTEPYDIEIGNFDLSSTSPNDITTSTQFQSTYLATIVKLITPPQHYQITYGYRSSNVLGETVPGTLTIKIQGPSYGNTNTATSFQFKYYHYEQAVLGTVKINYMLIGKNLVDNLLVRNYFMRITSPDAVCNALTTAIPPCSYIKPISLAHLNYKTYLSMTGITFLRNISPTTNLLKFDITIASLTKSFLRVNLQAQLLQISTFEFYFIAIDKRLYDITNFTNSNLILEHKTTLTNPASYSHIFTQIANPGNYFIGINQYKGQQILLTDFTLKINTPTLQNQVYGWLSSYCKSLTMYVLVMYGYAPPCTLYKNCQSCYVRPDLFCTQCKPNFSPVTLPNGNTDCQCQTPYQLVSGICDTIPFGCTIAERLANGSIKCHLCDPMKFLNLNSAANTCECYQHYFMDSNQVCQDFCGDGMVMQSQCDDGNQVSGDGCSTTCDFEPGFTCDTTVQPTQCKSSLMLLYRVESILKNSKSNSAVIKLHLRNPSIYTFPVYKHQFEPVSSHIKLKIILSNHPHSEVQLKGLTLLSVNEKNEIEVEFAFDYTIEDLEGVLQLNYELTKYANYTETLDFPMVGDNLPLKFEDKVDIYQKIGIVMMIGTVLGVLFLLIGLISPKFIGLESVLALQLVFFSQILIHDNKKFPIGFLFLENLQYSAGFNRIFDLTDYIPITYDSIKMNHIKRDKLIIENFNINFIVLSASFVFLTISFFLRSRNQKLVELNKCTDNKKVKKNPSEIPKENLLLKKVNDIAYFMSNQVAFWMFLPLLSALTAKMEIQDHTVTTDLSVQNRSWKVALSNSVVVLGFFLIFLVILNSFQNIWLSYKTIRLQHQRLQEGTYKRLLFIYLLFVGSLVFFANSVYVYHVYCSAIVLLIHIFFMVFIIVLNPYKYSLRVHFVGMVINNTIYLAALIVINIINYVDAIEHDISLLLGYTMLGLCSLSIVFTIIRLYYELRYGRQLEDKMAEEKLQKEHEEKLRKMEELRRRRAQMENEAKDKLSDLEKRRNMNFYLYENQVKEDQKKDLVEWLQNRAILDQKTKDKRYFEKFAEKPLNWYQVNQPQKFQQKMKEITDHFQGVKERNRQKKQDENYYVIASQLRQEIVSKNYKKSKELARHEKKMRLKPDYTMSVMKKGEEKYVHKAYDLTE